MKLIYVRFGEIPANGEPLLKNCKIVREVKNINHSSLGWL